MYEEIEIDFVSENGEILYTVLFDKETVELVARTLDITDPEELPEAFADFVKESLLAAVRKEK